MAPPAGSGHWATLIGGADHRRELTVAPMRSLVQRDPPRPAFDLARPRQVRQLPEPGTLADVVPADLFVAGNLGVRRARACPVAEMTAQSDADPLPFAGDGMGLGEGPVTGTT